MLRYMLDTNICIYVLKARAAELVDKFNAAQTELCISTITFAELMNGVEKSARPAQNRAGVERFVAQLDLLPFGAAAAAHYGELKARLERAGTPCRPFDILIGAHARAEGLTVVTNNIGEFARMPGVRVENWA